MRSWPEYSLANSIHRLFMKLDKRAIRRLFGELTRQSLAQGMVYEEEDGTKRPIPLMLRPRLITPEQRTYFLKTCFHMSRAFDKLPWLYFQNPKIQELFPFEPQEQEWLLKYFPKNPRSPHTVIERWDANTNFSGSDWKASFRFLEVNAVGVGGLHYTPTAERIILEVFLNTMRQLGLSLQVRLNDDVRQTLLWELQSHLKALGKRRCHIGLMLDDRSKGGPLDFYYLAKYYQAQGLQARVADPRDLALKKGEIMAGDFPLDILYRDSTLSELIEMEQDEKRPLKALRRAFQENVVVSGLGGEFDHKSALEIFSNPRFSRHFNQEERKYFRRHIPWTRLVREGRTTDPKGKSADLMKYALRHREALVLKPNRGYGGIGIMMGSEVSLPAWENQLAKALEEPGSHILQERCSLRRKKFPVLDEKGRVIEKSLNVVCGFIYSPYGLGILGRSSALPIVNVAQQGGMTAILICENRS